MRSDLLIHGSGCAVPRQGDQHAWIAENNRETGLDRKTIRAVLKGEKVKASTLAKVAIGMQEE